MNEWVCPDWMKEYLRIAYKPEFFNRIFPEDDMKQEQPFEIKEVFNILDNHTITLNRLIVEPTFGRLALELANYVKAANAEIRRLQSVVESLESQQQKPDQVERLDNLISQLSHDMETLSEHAAEHLQGVVAVQDIEIERLQQQLAAAPSWGEWQYATIENLENAPVGIYEFESFTGETMVRFKCDFRDGLPWKGSSTETADCVMIEECTRFRRLNYEPKPARVEEKKYHNEDKDGYEHCPSCQQGEWSHIYDDETREQS